MRYSASGPQDTVYNHLMVTLNAHFDGKNIVPDEPASLAIRSGARLRVIVENLDESRPAAPASRTFRPLNIKIDPELSNAIASEPEFNIEES